MDNYKTNKWLGSLQFGGSTLASDQPFFYFMKNFTKTLDGFQQLSLQRIVSKLGPGTFLDSQTRHSRQAQDKKAFFIKELKTEMGSP